MSESDSLATSSTGSDLEFFNQIIASMARPIPNSLTGMCEPIITGSFGLAPTPPPIIEHVLKCPLCLEPFREPKVLACFHSFCKSCLERQLDSNPAEKIVCPQCHVETKLSTQLGIESLLCDYGLENVMSRQLSDDRGLIFGSPSSTSSSPPLSDSPYDQNSNTATSSCTGCKNGERASAFCRDCSHFLCANCTMAHHCMHCFDGHRVDQLSHGSSPALSEKQQQQQTPCKCIQHRSQPLSFFCLTCNLVICQECTQSEHVAPAHHYEAVGDVADKQMRIMENLLQDARMKYFELKEIYKMVDDARNHLDVSTNRARMTVEETVRTLAELIEENKIQILRAIEKACSAKQVQLTLIDKKVQQVIETLAQMIEFTQRLVKYATPTEVMVFKQLLHTRLQGFLSYSPDTTSLQTNCELGVPPLNVAVARQQIANLIGLVRGSNEWLGLVPSVAAGMPPTPIGRPPSRQLIRSPAQNVVVPAVNYSDSNLLRPKHDFGGSSQSLGAFANFEAAFSNQYEKWSAGIDPSGGLQLSQSPEIDPNDKSAAVNALYPPRSQIKRHKMIYHCKFGEFGVMEGQFTEPSGVAVNAQNDIIVADTNNHRIQVFDKEGRFKFQFGECGKRDGQLLYPNRVAVNRVTGDFIVTERSPTHQIQIYNQYGQFMRKFGANILQHPRGVCVDNKSRIIVIECKVMRVIIFDMYGNILQKFSCSRYLEFPNGVCTNDKQEILISDNRAHCIKVFNYDGQFVRQIGGEGITNYPIGVGINSQGEVVVADNHNNFNLTVFSQDGTMVAALESKVKHAQCFDVALVEDGSVVLASKDYRLYLYRYQIASPN
ncbi:hypothetical protein AB6A40_000136 [Gnathostoma spinigerum]|uniref:Uncharacterized protein n=1 Tax=Gnathostoma spinigerum TaxID=75299 RepID=A0ABD6E9R7_9BILA